MRFLLSIKTVFPKLGGKVWYDDQECIDRFSRAMRRSTTRSWTEPRSGRQPVASRGLREPRADHLVPRHCTWPIPSNSSDMRSRAARECFGTAIRFTVGQATTAPGYIPRSCDHCVQRTLRPVGAPRTATSRPAHIVADRDERLGQPVVQNGIPLSKIHHAAFDAHLIGIDPDYRLHVSERLLVQQGGPMLEALKRLNGGTIHFPTRARDLPDRNRLAQRFERFRSAA
jgi:putative restriction endonuclease